MDVYEAAMEWDSAENDTAVVLNGAFVAVAARTTHTHGEIGDNYRRFLGTCSYRWLH